MQTLLVWPNMGVLLHGLCTNPPPPVNFGMLVAGRALQGAFAALLVPAAISLLATTFTDPKARARAFGIFGAIATAGGAVGLLIGGALIEYLS